MKTIFTTALALVFTLPLFAQLEKGMYSLGGQFEMAYQWQERQEPLLGLPAKGFSLNLNPTYDIFLTDHWMLGASIGGGCLQLR